MVIQDKGADEVGNCVVAIAQARKTKPLSVALMPSTLLMSTSLRVAAQVSGLRGSYADLGVSNPKICFRPLSTFHPA